jgi:HK97 family phage portal protein
MPKSLIRKLFNQQGSAPIPFPSKMNRGQGLYGSGIQDRFTMMNTMGTQGTLFAIIQLLSTGKQAHGPWRMYRKSNDNRVRYSSGDQGSDQRVEVLKHQALRLWHRPNPFMTGFDFREIGWQHMELAGEWYWVLNRGPTGKGIPLEMWPARPDRMEPIPDRDKFLAGWIYSGPSGETVPLSTSEVIQLRYPHPTDFYRGLSPAQSILADIDAAKYSAEWSRNFFLNSAQPGGIVTFNKRLTDEEFNEFTNRWREQHQGVARGHRVGVLEQGALWTSNTYTMRDMQFPELRKVTSDHIRQAYRIHQAMLGDSTDVNRANAQTALEIHVAFHEIPRLDREKNVLNTSFLEMFGAEDSVEFDYPSPFPPNREENNAELQTKAMAAFNLISAGYDPHDVLEVVGLPDMTTAVEASSTTQVIPPRWVPVPPGGGTAPTPGGAPAVPPGAQPAPAVPSAMYGRGGFWAQHDPANATSEYDRTHTTAHLTETVYHEIAHAARHLQGVADAPNPDSRDFNIGHTASHINQAAEHIGKLADHLRANYPAEGQELKALEAAHAAHYTEEVIPQTPAGAAAKGPAALAGQVQFRKLAEGKRVVTEPGACDECKSKARAGDCAPPFHYGCRCHTVEAHADLEVFSPEYVLEIMNKAFAEAKQNGNSHSKESGE